MAPKSGPRTVRHPPCRFTRWAPAEHGAPLTSLQACVARMVSGIWVGHANLNRPRPTFFRPTALWWSPHHCWPAVPNAGQSVPHITPTIAVPQPGSSVRKARGHDSSKTGQVLETGSNFEAAWCGSTAGTKRNTAVVAGLITPPRDQHLYSIQFRPRHQRSGMRAVLAA